MGRKRKLRKRMIRRGLIDQPAVVVCVGRSCGKPAIARALADDLRAYALQVHPEVGVERVGCLGVCKQGPVAASYPRIKIKKRVDLPRGRRLVDRAARS